MTPKPKEAKHTPTPWTKVEHRNGTGKNEYLHGVSFYAPKKRGLGSEIFVALTQGIDISKTEFKENMDLVYKAINAYDRDQEIKRELLEGGRELLSAIDDNVEHLPDGTPYVKLEYVAEEREHLKAAIQNARRG